MKLESHSTSAVFLLAFILLALPALGQKESIKSKVELDFIIENRFQLGTSFDAKGAGFPAGSTYKPNWGAAFRYQVLFGLKVEGYFIPRLGVGVSIFHTAISSSDFRYPFVDPIFYRINRLDYLVSLVEFPIGFTVVPLPNRRASPYISFDITQRVITSSTSFSTNTPARVVITNGEFDNSAQRYRAGFDFALGIQLNRSIRKETKIGFFANLLDFFYDGYRVGQERNRLLYSMQLGMEASIVLSPLK